MVGKPWRYTLIFQDAEVIMRLGGGDVLLDADDIERVIELGGWYVMKPSGYVRRNVYTPGVTGPTGGTLLHRFIMNATTSDPDVDHRNRNKLDNRKSNLRFTPPAGRSQNRTKSKDKTSQFLGVSWDRKTNKWRARAGQTVIGYYADETEAGQAAVSARAELHPYSTD